MKKIVLTLVLIYLVLGKSMAAFTSSARDFSGLKISPFLLSIGTALTNVSSDTSASFDTSPFSAMKYEEENIFVKVNSDELQFIKTDSNWIQFIKEESDWFQLIKVDTLEAKTLLEECEKMDNYDYEGHLYVSENFYDYKSYFSENFVRFLYQKGIVARTKMPFTLIDTEGNQKEMVLTFTKKKKKALKKYNSDKGIKTSGGPSFSWSDGHLSYNKMAIFYFFLPFVSLIFIFYIPYIIGLWNVFEKAEHPGWTALIPIYNIVITLRIIDRPLWWLLLYLIPGAAMVIRIVILHDLSKSFGKDAGYTIGLYFLPFIFFPILGFGDAKYQGPSGIL